MQITDAVGPLCFRFGLRNRGKQNGSEDSYDGDDHEQLDQGKSLINGRLIYHKDAERVCSGRAGRARPAWNPGALPPLPGAHLSAPLLLVVILGKLYFHTFQFALRFKEETPNAEDKANSPPLGLVDKALLNVVVPGIGWLSEGLNDVLRLCSLRYVEVLAVECEH